MSRVLILLSSWILSSWALAQGKAPARLKNQTQTGAYVVKIAGCADCHTVDVNHPFSGGYRLATPFGAFYTPNITPDKETGIGQWTFKQFEGAVRWGRRPSGGVYFPVFPYRSYTKITTEDLHLIYRYLMSVPPVKTEIPPHQLQFPFSQRWLVHFWQDLYFTNFLIVTGKERIQIGVGPFMPDQNKSKQWNRGAYIVESLAHCTECHTPRNKLGGLVQRKWLAGSAFSLPGKIVPNITPDKITGVGRWTRNDWRLFLRTGIKPDCEMVSDEMSEVIRNTSSLTDQDREAIITYLQSLSPVHHWVLAP